MFYGSPAGISALTAVPGAAYRSRNACLRTAARHAMLLRLERFVVDRAAIQFLIGAFIRNHVNPPAADPDGTQPPAGRVDDRLPSLRARAPDVQVAVPVLGRGVPSPDQRPLTLARVDLRGLSLNGTRLNGATFQKSNLARAALTNVWRGGADDPEMSHEAHRPGTLG